MEEITKNYTKRYPGALQLLRVLTSTQSRVLEIISSKVEYNSNKIVINAHTRESISYLAVVKIDTVNKVIPILIKLGFIMKVESCTYQVNPMLYFCGSENERLKLSGLYRAMLTNRNTKSMPIVTNEIVKQEESSW